jgi:hypothetical protein
MRHVHAVVIDDAASIKELEEVSNAAVTTRAIEMVMALGHLSEQDRAVASVRIDVGRIVGEWSSQSVVASRSDEMVQPSAFLDGGKLNKKSRATRESRGGTSAGDSSNADQVVELLNSIKDCVSLRRLGYLLGLSAGACAAAVDIAIKRKGVRSTPPPRFRT